MPIYDGDGFDEADPEEDFFPDDVAMITNLLKEGWSLGLSQRPIISYDLQTLYADARSSYIYVYHVSGYNSISSTDYRSTQVTTFLGIKISCPFRKQLYRTMREVYRILLSNRRAGPSQLNGYTYFEIISHHLDDGELGWYSSTIDLKLMSYCRPIFSPGFGPEVNSRYPKKIPQGTDTTYEEGDYDLPPTGWGD